MGFPGEKREKWVGLDFLNSASKNEWERVWGFFFLNYFLCIHVYLYKHMCTHIVRSNVNVAFSSAI